MKIIEPKKISKYLYSKINDDGWKSILSHLIKSRDFDDVLIALKESSDDGNRFSPKVKDFLNPYISCPYDDLKVVVLKDEPYNSILYNNGLAFSCNQDGNRKFELTVIFSKIIKSIYGQKKRIFNFNNDLRVWAEQGILLLNASLTADIKTPNVYNKLWTPFTTAIIDSLNAKKENLIYILIGPFAQNFEYLIDENANDIIKLDSVDGYKWEYKDVFNDINERLTKLHKTPIIW